MKEIKHVGFGVNGFQLRNPFDGRAAILEPAGWLHENPKFGKEITFDKDVAGLEEHRGWVKTPLYDENFTRHPAAPDAIEYIAAHYDALLEALEYIRARKEEARAAYLTDDAGNWQAEIEALARVRETISSVAHLYTDDMARADAYRQYLHLRACNAEEEVERLRATTCPCKGTDDLCRCQNVRPSTSQPLFSHLENDDNG